MELESYFDFTEYGEIRIKGHRIYLEDVLHEYLKGMGPEQLLAHFTTLNLEKIHAVILYYLANREKVEAYLHQMSAEAEARYQESLSKPNPKRDELRERFRKIRESRQTNSELAPVGKSE